MKSYLVNEKKGTNQFITLAFMIFLVSLFILNIITKDLEISKAERRRLENLPKFDVESLIDGSYMTEFEKYALDQFPFRETFRRVKGNFDLIVLQKMDVNDIFVYKNHLIKLEYPYNNQSIEHFSNYIRLISDKYLNQSNVYLSIIPDKAYFIPENKYPTLNYEKFEAAIQENLENIKYINLFERLVLDDYYYTDTHWKQENLLKVVDYLGEVMGIETTVAGADYIVKTYTDFMGVYYSQSALNVPKDDLNYLFTEDMNDVIIKNYENIDNENGTVYDIEQLDSLDPYNVYLSGASPLIEVINPNNTTGKELIIFRDSFASSLAPLLLQEYSKVTLIDTRYMSFEYLGDYVDFSDKDVLFLYSTTVVNNSQMLK